MHTSIHGMQHCTVTWAYRALAWRMGVGALQQLGAAGRRRGAQIMARCVLTCNPIASCATQRLQASQPCHAPGPAGSTLPAHTACPASVSGTHARMHARMHMLAAAHPAARQALPAALPPVLGRRLALEVAHHTCHMVGLVAAATGAADSHKRLRRGASAARTSSTRAIACTALRGRTASAAVASGSASLHYMLVKPHGGA